MSKNVTKLPPNWPIRGHEVGYKVEVGFVILQIRENGDLRIRLNEEGREYVQDAHDRGENIHTDYFLMDVLEGARLNGYISEVAPHWIGALTDAPILAGDVIWEDEDGQMYDSPKVLDPVWWYEGYQIRSAVERMMEDGYVDFRLAA